MEKIQCKLTKTGLDALKKHRESLKIRLSKLNAQMDELMLSENIAEDMEFQQLRREKVYLQDEIAHLDKVISSAKVLRKKQYSEAEEGCRVHLVNHRICYMVQLVNELEANTLNGKISCNSPMGKVLVGKRVGEELVVQTPLGPTEFKVAAIK